MKIKLVTGDSEVKCPAQVRFEFAGMRTVGAPTVKVDGVEELLNWRQIAASTDSYEFEAVSAAGCWRWRCSTCRNTAGVPGWRVEMGGRLNEPRHLVEIESLVLDAIPATRLLTQGISMGECANLSTCGAEQRFSGHYQLMINTGSGILQLTLPPRQSQPTHFVGVAADGVVKRVAACQEVLNFGRREIVAVPVELYAHEDGFVLMDAYADAHAAERGERRIPAAQVGWNSWDYYRWTITEAEVLKNAEMIARDPVLRKHVKRIIVDDGWQYCYGEWDANPLFPNGMAYLARELTAMGFEPGLWLAPAIVEPHARIAQWDTEMLGLGENGHPCLAYECMQRYGFVLDPTVEKSRQYLRDLFDRYASMGYKYFKLDFLGAVLGAKKFHDAAVPRSEMVRRIVEPIREAVGERAMLLGCNYHFTAGSDLIDAVRVASDIHGRWDCVRHNTVSVAARYWSNGKWWLNDPDFAICRSFDTSDDPDMERLQACLVYNKPEETSGNPIYNLVERQKRDQAEILLSVAICSGGAINFSDDMTKLNASGVDLARRTAAAEPGKSGRPLDLFDKELPEYWLQEVSVGRRLLLVNWDELPAQRSFDLSAAGCAVAGIRDFWTDESIPLPEDGRLSLTLKPRSCRLLILQKKGEACL